MTKIGAYEASYVPSYDWEATDVEGTPKDWIIKEAEVESTVHTARNYPGSDILEHLPIHTVSRRESKDTKVSWVLTDITWKMLVEATENTEI